MSTNYRLDHTFYLELQIGNLTYKTFKIGELWEHFVFTLFVNDTFSSLYDYMIMATMDNCIIVDENKQIYSINKFMEIIYGLRRKSVPVQYMNSTPKSWYLQYYIHGPHNLLRLPMSPECKHYGMIDVRLS